VRLRVFHGVRRRPDLSPKTSSRLACAVSKASRFISSLTAIGKTASEIAGSIARLGRVHKLAGIELDPALGETAGDEKVV